MQRFLFHCFALLVVTLCVAWMLHSSDEQAFARINSMPPAKYIAYARGLHSHSLFVHFITFLFLGGLYLAAIELIVYGLGKMARKR
jgi:hypothetical protein